MPHEGRTKLVGLGVLFVLVGAIVAVLAIVQPGRSAGAGVAPPASRPPTSSSPPASSSPPTGSRPPADSPLPGADPAAPNAVHASGASASSALASAGPTISASGGGPGARVEDLSALTPVQAFNVSGVRSGPVRVGALTYADSVRFTCDSGGHDSSGDLDYVVTGYSSMNATIGVPHDDTHAAGVDDAMTVSFFNNGAGSQTSQPVTVSSRGPQRVRLRFRGASQLEISCSAVNTATESPEYMDLALANATIGP